MHKTFWLSVRYAPFQMYVHFMNQPSFSVSFRFYFPPPPPLPLMKFGWYIGINATVCPSVQILLGRYLLYWSTFLTKHDMVVCYHSTECHAEIWWFVIKRQSVMQICWFATSKVKVTSFHCIVWTAGFFCNQLTLTVHHHKPECLVKTFVYYFQGQGHSRTSKYQ